MKQPMVGVLVLLTLTGWARAAEQQPARAMPATSTNSAASIFAWTGGLKFRGKFDDTPDVTRFAETLEQVCIETVESGAMTKDLAILIGPDQAWMTTEQFFEAVRANLETKMGSWQ